MVTEDVLVAGIEPIVVEAIGPCRQVRSIKLHLRAQTEGSDLYAVFAGFVLQSKSPVRVIPRHHEVGGSAGPKEAERSARRCSIGANFGIDQVVPHQVPTNATHLAASLVL